MSLSTLKWSLESYFINKDGSWENVNINKKNSYILLNYPTVLLVDGGITLHSIDLSEGAGKLRVQYANCNIGIKFINTNDKIRISLMGDDKKTGSDYCAEIIAELKKYVTVIQHSSHIERNQSCFQTQKLIDAGKYLLPDKLNVGDENASVLPESLLLPDKLNVGAENASVLPESVIKPFYGAIVSHPQFPDKLAEFTKKLLHLSDSKTISGLKD